MQHDGRNAFRSAVVTALSALLLVLGVTMASGAQFPSAAVATCALGAPHSTVDSDSSRSSAAVMPASRHQLSHRIDGPTPALLRRAVGVARPSESTACGSASVVQQLGTTRSTRDGRAPPV
jgi:hypothetical protein